ncbi:MAG: glutamine--fructose-6-phosphate transaminase (isomerizing) [Candidatus Spechtbacterales bacterium]|nr:glutamine--fructose-6-phosphate transaminase (isomerizing) [Candidatus Spechtbacterales bacterium]
MCGIIGYIGDRTDPKIGLDALKRLEYRGYDSAGCAVYDPKEKDILSERAVGKVSELDKKLNKAKLSGSPFIFHTRWATHGAPSENNAHPHFDCNKEFYIAHNGIIENYQDLKDKLKKYGHKFTSDTDTEVLAHLIEYLYDGDLLQAVQKTLSMVVGTYGIVVISKKSPNELITARLGSPLLIGVGDGEYFISSDPAGVLEHTKKVVYMEDGEIARLKPDSMELISQDKKAKKPVIEEIQWDVEEAQKGGYPHFMIKEIMEQPKSVSDTLAGRLVLEEGNAKLGGLESVADRLRDIKKIHIVACGTAYYAGLVGKYMIEDIAKIPVEVDVGSEFRYRDPVLDRKTDAFLCISQSGETADTLAPLKEAKRKGLLTLGIVNVVGSTIAREVDAGIYNHAGPEIGVASTKAFTSQLTALGLTAIFLARQRDMSQEEGRKIVEEMEKLPRYINKILKNTKKIEKVAKKYHKADNMLYLGRKYNNPIALEGALKLKEISYIHAEGYAGGEMKHGPIALIDKDFPTFAVMPRDSIYEKMLSNIEEIKARSGPIIAVTTEGNKDIKRLTKDVIYIPDVPEFISPIVSVIPLQIFAYHVGIMRGHNVDKPRNLAKSVTVE